MKIIFEKPFIFFLSFPIFYLYYLYFFKKGNYEGIFITVTEKKKLNIFKILYFNIHYLFLLISILILIVSMAGPKKIESKIPIQKSGRAFVFCLDISSSMKAIEKSGKSRLEIAKEEIINFVKQRPYDLYGLVLFAKYPFTYVPLTIDNKFLTEKLKEVEPLIIEDGTSIGLGLESAIAQLKNFKGAGKIIILLSDGVESSNKFSSIQAAKEAKENNIKIYSIIPGDNKEVLYPFRNSKGKIELKTITLPINVNILQKISSITGVNNIFYAKDKLEIKKSFDVINRSEPVTYRINLYKQYINIYKNYLFYSFIFYSIFLVLFLFNLKIEY